MWDENTYKKVFPSHTVDLLLRLGTLIASRHQPVDDLRVVD
jgi:hypothetical protein